MPIRSARRRSNEFDRPDIEKKDQLASQDRPDGMRSSLPTWGARRHGSRRDGARIDPLFTMSDNTRPPRLAADADANSYLCGRDWTRLVEPDGIEPTTSCLQSRRSPN
jgi:hypothetical protein